MESPEHSSDVKESNKEFMCTYDDCHKTFTSLSHLNRHEDVHLGKTYVCNECGTTFSSQYALKRHIDNIHLKKNPKQYKCEYCEEDFNKKSWLNRHIFKHTGIKPYMCTFEDCDAKFLVPSKLRRHLKIHEGYNCPKEDCNEKFAKFTDVRRHLKLAHPKVYKCPECDLEFTRSNNLRTHSVVHKPYRNLFMCPKEGCGRFYSTKSNLIHHVTSYHVDRPFNCTYGRCFRSFKTQEDLDAHVSKHISKGRLKKKKTKSKPKPSFAAELAGLVPKKWQIEVLKDASKEKHLTSTDVKTSSECSSDLAVEEHQSETQLESVAETQEILLSLSVAENCEQVPSLSSDIEMKSNDQNLNANSDDSNCVQNDDIQALLNTIEKRKGFEIKSTVQKTQCISIEA